MRFIFGVIVGAVLTVGVAFVADATGPTSGADGKTARRMVNWNVVSGDLAGLSSSAQTLWGRLVGEAKVLDKKTGT